MKAEIELYEIFDKFLAGAMSPDEKTAFLNRLSSDSDFSMEFKLYEITNEIIVDNGLSSVKQKLYNLHNPFWTPAKVLLSSVAVLGLLSIGSLIYVSEFEKDSFEIQKVAFETEKTIEIETADADNLEGNDEKKISLDSKKSNKSSKLQASLLTIKDEKKEFEYANKINESKGDNVKTVEKEVEISVADAKKNCDEVQISANILIENACQGANSGIITIDTANIEGGKGPYTYAVLSSSKKVRKAEIPFDRKTKYDGLKAGYYNFFIKDVNGCTSYSERSALVNEVSCSAKQEREFKLSNGAGVTLMILSKNQKAELIVSDKKGQPVYLEQFNGDEVIWYGKDAFDRKVKKGNYTYQLKYNDGTFHSGSIVID